MSESRPPNTRFKRTIRELLHDKPDLTPLPLAVRTGFPVPQRDDLRTCGPHPLEAIAGALFAKEVAEWSFPELERQLSNHPDASDALGFQDVPNQSSLWRYWNTQRLSKDLRLTIKRNAVWTRDVATELGHPLGKSALHPEKKGAVSARTESRLIREKLESVPNEMVRLVADEWNFLPKRAKNQQYDLRSFIETECLMGVEQLAAEQGSEIYNDNHGDGPSGDTMLHYIKRLNLDDILRRFDNSTGLMVNRAKRHLEFKRPSTVAIDITELPYYGNATDSEWLVDRRGYTDKKHD